MLLAFPLPRQNYKLEFQMKMSGLARRGIVALVGACVAILLAPAAMAFQKPFDNDRVLTQARASYYSLKSEGLAEFQCSMTPNWEALLAELHKTNPAGAEAAVKKLSSLQFSVTLPTGGDAQVTHNTLEAENEEVAKGLKDIYSGMEQMTVGFFQTWSAFMVSPALPEPGNVYDLQKDGIQYRLSYKDGSSDVVTILDRDFAISSTRVTNATFDSTLEPQFRKSAPGLLLLAGYHATYKGTAPGDNTDLTVAIDYQAVDGFQLPRTLNLKGTYGNSPFAVEGGFSNCAATKAGAESATPASNLKRR